MKNANRIPAECLPFLEEFTDTIEKHFKNYLDAIYIYGSIADGGFDHKRSDIDLIIFLNQDIPPQTLSRVLSQSLNTKWGKRVDAMFLSSSLAGKGNHEMNPYPYMIEGKVHSGHWNVNAITWWSIQNQGILLYGKPIDIKILWEQVEKTLIYNIEHYWPRRAAKPYTFLTDEQVADAVTTLCRILYTWKEKKIVSKKEAVLWASDNENIQSFRELKEAERLLEKKSSIYFSRVYRALACKRFVLKMIDHIQPGMETAKYIEPHTKSNVNL